MCIYLFCKIDVSRIENKYYNVLLAIENELYQTPTYEHIQNHNSNIFTHTYLHNIYYIIFTTQIHNIYLAQVCSSNIYKKDTNRQRNTYRIILIEFI